MTTANLDVTSAVEMLKDGARRIDGDGTPSQVGPDSGELLAVAALLTEMEKCLEWALAEAQGFTKYDNPVQRQNCLDRAIAVMRSVK